MSLTALEEDHHRSAQQVAIEIFLEDADLDQHGDQGVLVTSSHLLAGEAVPVAA